MSLIYWTSTANSKPTCEYIQSMYNMSRGIVNTG